jgi:hypothetical protein
VNPEENTVANATSERAHTSLLAFDLTVGSLGVSYAQPASTTATASTATCCSSGRRTHRISWTVSRLQMPGPFRAAPVVLAAPILSDNVAQPTYNYVPETPDQIRQKYPVDGFRTSGCLEPLRLETLVFQDSFQGQTPNRKTCRDAAL